MKLLINEWLPRALERLFTGHECRTVQELGGSPLPAALAALRSIAPGRVATIRA